jgi:hypothetical protein
MTYANMLKHFLEGTATESMISILLYRKFLVVTKNEIVLSDTGKKLIENIC